MPDPPNATIASLFDELADLYELDGEGRLDPP